jgi:uncharacterized protein YndB with AHSA1/START domain
MTRNTVAVAGLLWLAACATVPGPEPKAGDTSRVLAHEVFVPAPPERVFAAWTTEEGVRTFFAPAARIEATPGGAYEPLFDPGAPAGSRGCEGCRVLAVDPPRHLAVTWTFPPSLPSIRGQETRVDVTFTPERGGTRVFLAQTGWRPGEAWDRGYAYFDHAWALVLSRLARSFEAGPIDWSKE